MGPAPRVHPRRRRRFSNPSRIGTAHLRLSRSPSLYRRFSSFSLVASPSPCTPPSSSSLAVSCFHVAIHPLRLCLSRPSRSLSLDLSLSERLLSFFHHVLLHRPRPPPPPPPPAPLPSPSVLPPRLPGFYLSLASTRSLSGNERRNTLATFNRPALSSAYTYLAGSASPSSSSPARPDHPATHALVLISILPPRATLGRPNPSPAAHHRRAPTSRFLLLIFTTNIVYKYLRALSLVFRAFRYARYVGRVFPFPRKN